jgi:hypothetical protein
LVPSAVKRQNLRRRKKRCAMTFYSIALAGPDE